MPEVLPLPKDAPTPNVCFGGGKRALNPPPPPTFPTFELGSGLALFFLDGSQSSSSSRTEMSTGGRNATVCFLVLGFARPGSSLGGGSAPNNEGLDDAEG